MNIIKFDEQQTMSSFDINDPASLRHSLLAYMEKEKELENKTFDKVVLEGVVE